MQGSPREAMSQAMHTTRRIAATSFWHAELLPRGRYEASYVAETSVIGFAFDSQSGVHSFGSDRRTGYRSRPNSLAYVPATCDVYSASEHGGEYLKIAVVSDRAERKPTASRFSDAIDRAAIAAAQGLRRSLLTGDRVDLLQCERFVETLKERVACVLNRPAVDSPARPWMTPRRLRLVDEMIEAKLDATVTVQDLAEALGLSAGFFSRAFKAAVGKAPHDYIVDRRVSRARALLQGTRLRLADIAHASGFASHAHMTATFRSRLGVSPRELHPRLPARHGAKRTAPG